VGGENNLPPQPLLQMTFKDRDKKAQNWQGKGGAQFDAFQLKDGAVVGTPLTIEFRPCYIEGPGYLYQR